MQVLEYIRNKIVRRFINLKTISRNYISYDEIIRIELLVGMCLLAIVAGILYITIGAFLGLSLFIILNYLIFFSTVVPFVLYLITVGKYNQAKLVMMLIGSIFMFLKAASLGRDSGMNLSMLIIVFATFAFYSIDDYKYILLSLCFTSSLIILLEVTDYSLLGHDTATNMYEYEFNYISTILFCVLFFYVILRVNQYMNTRLRIVNGKLLLKNKTLKKVNEELDSYVYRTSHDMRAPLTSLMGLINLVKEAEDLKTTHELAIMQENCVNKLDLHIQQIIHLSKNIKTESLVQQINFRSMLNDIFEELSFFEHIGNIQKNILISGSTNFYSDSYRIKTILNNLISNSFKYYRSSEPNPNVDIAVSISEKSAVIVIKDNGIGIASENLENIFDMFYRASTQSKGSGLGLYIVKEMVAKLNGTVQVQSRINTFTQFVIELPNNKNKYSN